MPKCAVSQTSGISCKTCSRTSILRRFLPLYFSQRSNISITPLQDGVLKTNWGLQRDKAGNDRFLKKWRALRTLEQEHARKPKPAWQRS